MMKIKLTKKLPGGGYYKSFNLKALYNFLYQNTNKIITKLWFILKVFSYYFFALERKLL